MLFLHVRYVDVHYEIHAPAAAVAGAHDHRVSLLFLEVIRPLRQDLAVVRINGEVIRVEAPQAVDKLIAIGIRRCDGIPYRLIPPRRVLSNGKAPRVAPGRTPANGSRYCRSSSQRSRNPSNPIPPSSFRSYRRRILPPHPDSLPEHAREKHKVRKGHQTTVPSKSAETAARRSLQDSMLTERVIASGCSPRAMSSAPDNRISVSENASVVLKRSVPTNPLSTVARPPSDAMPISTKVES